MQIIVQSSPRVSHSVAVQAGLHHYLPSLRLSLCDGCSQTVDRRGRGCVQSGCSSAILDCLLMRSMRHRFGGGCCEWRGGGGVQAANKAGLHKQAQQAAVGRLATPAAGGGAKRP